MNSVAALVPWILGIGVLGGVFALWRRRARDAPAEQPQAQLVASIPFDQGFGSPEELADAAVHAEQQGDVDLAAELLRTAGMYMRAIALYRRVGNIQKVAELEILVTELQRLGAALPASSSPAEANGSGAEARGQSLRPVALMRSLGPPRVSSRPPQRGASLAPPGRESQRPRAPGLSVDELELMLGASSAPDLNNIEIYYRLGLAHLANGHEGEARQAFLSVEQASPGYRDAANYLAELSAGAIRSEPPVNSNATPVQSEPAARRSSVAEELVVRSGRDHR